MSPTAQQPQLNVAQTEDYRESYANSVQVRVSVWDFQLVSACLSESPDQVTIRNHQAIFLSRSRRKHCGMCWADIAQYEQAFARSTWSRKAGFPQGPVN